MEADASISFDTKSDFNAPICATPITVALKVNETVGKQVRARNGAGTLVAAKVANRLLLVDVLPGETVNVEVFN